MRNKTLIRITAGEKQTTKAAPSLFSTCIMTGELVNVKGICLVNVQYGNIHRTVTLIVMKEHRLNLLRLNRFEPLGINISEKLNKYTGKSVTLKFDPNDTPICIKARKVPHAMKEKTDTELDKLIEQGILEPVNHPIWSSLISTPVNPDGRLFRFTENGISLMMGEKDTLKMTTETIDGKKKVVIKLEMVAEDMMHKTKQINLNFSSEVKMKLICHEEGLSLRTFIRTEEESEDSEVRN
ncbi:hypothetical protein T01_1682 [Trichinella spiralis]|uniref:Uncharacterized protein n=1 Tax=Trichinella spiralis TaxID=6334 RepID=A0A0V1ARC5_TRISP|nr:hypothetical protein T01_1682 [Trichinella spiralis]